MSRARLRHWPIAKRMLVSALVLIILTLPLAGTLLSASFRDAVHSALDDRLAGMLNVVIAGIAFDPATDALVLDRRLGDPRFERVYSGWYWQVTDNSTRELTSRSLWDQRLPEQTGQQRIVTETSGPQGQTLRLVQQTVQLPNLPDRLRVTVAADMAEVRGEIARFETLLAVSLTVLGLLLLLLIGWQIQWGLAPLRRLEQNLGAVESGRADTLATDLPEELARLARATNQLLARDQLLIERGRSAAGNLAHALKTPVAVLQTLVEKLPPAQQPAFQEELQRLNGAVRHHLARAAAAGPAGLGGGIILATALEPVIQGLSTLAKRRGLRFDQALQGPEPVHIEQQDIQEMVGNLLENAVNWAHQHVRLNVTQTTDGIAIVIEDDGPGLTDAECQQVLSRGTRLDESRSGSGLGLSIVAELAGLYRGHLSLGRSRLGGLQARLDLPST